MFTKIVSSVYRKLGGLSLKRLKQLSVMCGVLYLLSLWCMTKSNSIWVFLFCIGSSFALGFALGELIDIIRKKDKDENFE